jgi:hypothetical protein
MNNFEKKDINKILKKFEEKVADFKFQSDEFITSSELFIESLT